MMRSAWVLAIMAALLVTGCGKSEEEIRAEERARMLNDLQAMKALQEQTPAPAAPAPQPVASAAPAPLPSPKAQLTGASGLREIGRYRAWIGDVDLVNSQGQKLTKAWQILRQDRANVHKWGITQPGDEGDRFFASERNRAIMESMMRGGSIDRQAELRLLMGNVSVEVRILGHGDTGDYVSVTVL